jgi:hypothetical protein
MKARASFVSRKDVFAVHSADLGRLNKIVVGHDNTWLGAGWFLDKVEDLFLFSLQIEN